MNSFTMRAGMLWLLLATISATADSVTPTLEDRFRTFYLGLPNFYFQFLLDGPTETVDGQELHPKVQYYLEDRRKGTPSVEKRKRQRQWLLNPPEREGLRKAVDRGWTLRTKNVRAMESVKDVNISGPLGDIPVRIYRPDVDISGPLPVLLYFHGGGWLIGSVDAVDRAVRLIANEAKLIVVSVDYRLAPEHRFPAAHNEAYAAYQWTLENAGNIGGDASRVAVGGDSAGGNMAAWIALQSVKDGLTAPTVQLLYYPVVDMNMDHYPSYQLFGEGYGLDKHFGDMMTELVLRSPVDKDDLRLSPIKAENLANVSPAIIATAGFDMLRDQGKAYAQRLRQEGVKVHYINYDALIHGFLQESGTIDEAEKASVETARLLGEWVRQ